MKVTYGQVFSSQAQTIRTKRPGIVLNLGVCNCTSLMLGIYYYIIKGMSHGFILF